MPFTPAELDARFAAKVRHDPATGCLLWTAAVDKDGYGRFKTDTWTVSQAHRWAWEQENGPVPRGLVVRHTCDVPACVQPAHMRLGTHADNVRDREERGRGVRRGEPPLRAQQHGTTVATRWYVTCQACGPIGDFAESDEADRAAHAHTYGRSPRAARSA